MHYKTESVISKIGLEMLRVKALKFKPDLDRLAKRIKASRETRTISIESVMALKNKMLILCPKYTTYHNFSKRSRTMKLKYNISNQKLIVFMDS